MNRAGVSYLRRSVPERPRWLMLRGKEHGANNIIHDIEREAVGVEAERKSLEAISQFIQSQS